jgi:hypothetical protein
VLEDDECLLLAVEEEEENEQQRIVANIRYKSVEGLSLEKDAIRILLKGAQEVVVEPPKGDKDTSKFR